MARSTMRGFSKRMKQVASELEENTDKLMRKVVITVVSAVALRTPVDTGRARANWRTNIGAALPGLVGSFPEGSDGSTGGTAAAQAINESIRVMQGYEKGDVYISNNLPYIGRLNAGWSQQAPVNFVESAIMSGLNAIRKARLIK